MALTSNQTASTAELTPDAGGRSKCAASIIEEEPLWRRQSRSSVESSSESRVVVTRWRSFEHRVFDVSAETPADHHVVAIVLRHENVSFSVSGRTVLDGAATPGMVHVAEPTVSTRCIFR